MKKLTLLIFIGIGILSCNSSKILFDNENSVGVRQKTSNRVDDKLHFSKKAYISGKINILL